MKYLKTFEEIIYGSNIYNTLINDIKKWMKKYKLFSINIEKLGIVEEIDDMDRSWHRTGLDGLEKYVVKKLVLDNDSLLIFTDVFKDEELFDENNNCELWERETWEEIWNYLKKLTPDEIDDIRAENEAEKFNF